MKCNAYEGLESARGTEVSNSGSGFRRRPGPVLNYRASFCPAAESSSESSPTADDLTANLLEDLQSTPSNSLSNSDIMDDSSVGGNASDAISVVALEPNVRLDRMKRTDCRCFSTHALHAFSRFALCSSSLAFHELAAFRTSSKLTVALENRSPDPSEVTQTPFGTFTSEVTVYVLRILRLPWDREKRQPRVTQPSLSFD